MKNSLKILIALCLAFTMALSTAACKKTGKEDIPSSSAVEETVEDSSIEESSQEEQPEESSEIEDYEDYEEPVESIYTEPESESSDIELEDTTDEVDEFEFAEELYVNNASKPVNDNFLGVNGLHMAFAFMPDKMGNRTPLEKWQRDTEYDRIAKTMGVNQIRSFYSSSIVWDYNAKKLEWDVNKNPYLSGFYDSLKAWQDRGVEVALSAHWSLAAFIGKAHDSGVVSSFAGDGWYVKDDLDTTLKNYSDFMKKSVLNLEANGIYNVKYWLAFTEANNTFGSGIEGRKYDEVCELYKKAVTALDEGIKASGRREAYKIVGPCDNYRLDFEYTDPEQYSIMCEYTMKNLKGVVDILGTHIYSRANEFLEDSHYLNISTTMGKTVEAAKNKGWEIWLDEFNVKTNASDSYTPEETIAYDLKNPLRGVALGASINGVMNLGFDNSFVWALADMMWSDNTSNNYEFLTGLQVGGYLPSPLISMTPYYSWYSLSLLSRYIGQGTVYQTEEGFSVYISCIERTDGEWTVVVTNYNIIDTPIHINFEEAMGGKTFYRHLYDVNNIIPTEEAKIIPASAKASNVETGFYDMLPGYSVAVYTTVKD